MGTSHLPKSDPPVSVKAALEDQGNKKKIGKKGLEFPEHNLITSPCNSEQQ